MTAKKVVTMGFVLVLAFALMLSIAFTQDANKEMPMTKSPVEGTWRLVSSTLPDGTVLKPPHAQGLFSIHNGLRNFNVFTRTPDGITVSYSVISKYKITDSTWTETLLYSCMNNEVDGSGLTYRWEEQTKTVPLKKDGNKISFTPPFDPPELVFEGDKLTATMEGQFVDVWERVKK